MRFLLDTNVCIALLNGGSERLVERVRSHHPDDFAISSVVRADLTMAEGTAGNLTSDAHLAALAIEHGYAVYSTDNDFKRFAGVEHVNPLAS